MCVVVLGGEGGGVCGRRGKGSRRACLWGGTVIRKCACVCVCVGGGGRDDGVCVLVCVWGRDVDRGLVVVMLY